MLQVLGRRPIAERGMTTTPVVKHLDVIEQIGARFIVRGVTRAVYAFVLQAVEEAFRRRVVPAVTLAAHRAGHAELDQLVLEHVAGVLGEFNPSSQRLSIGGCDGCEEAAVSWGIIAATIAFRSCALRRSRPSANA